VIPTYNRIEYLKRCLRSIKENTRVEHEVIVVDGGSNDGTREFLESQVNVRPVLEGRPGGVVRAFNKGFGEAEGEYICWLNDDVVLEGCALDKMVDFLEDETQSMVGIGAFYFKTPGDPKASSIQSVFGLPYANFGMMRTSLLRELGYWDECFVRGGGDPDLSLRVWEWGMVVAGCKGAHLVHLCVKDEMRSANSGVLMRDDGVLEEKWSERVKATIRWAGSNREIFWRYLDRAGRVEFLFWCGKVYEEDGRLDWAERCYLEALDIDPARIDILYNLGSVYQRAGQMNKARDMFKEVLRLGAVVGGCRFLGGAYYHLGIIYKEYGDFSRARQYLKMCLEVIPDHKAARRELEAWTH
jgi:glycosyltransferase involved in cell wall biosynthesis